MSRIPVSVVASLLLASAAAAAETNALPTLRAPDSVPPAWTNLTLDWKGSWDETLGANYNEGAWKQAVEGHAELRQAADRVLRLRRIALLEALIRRFPDRADKRAEACREIAKLYQGLGDRTRAAQWLKQVADAPPQPAAQAEAYAGILECAEPLAAMPEASAWVEYAAGHLLALEKAGELKKTDPPAVLARQRLLALRHAERQYEEQRRLLNRWEASDGAGSGWTNRAALLKEAGHLAQAAALHEAAGRTNEARALGAAVLRGEIKSVGRNPTRELEMRLNALRAKERAQDPALGEAELVQGTLRACAESGSMWNEEPSLRVRCWVSVDRMLHGLKPESLQALRELQEQAGAPLAEALRGTEDEKEIDRLFQLYPWAAGTHERLVEFGEKALQEGQWDRALRAFRQVASHAADRDLTAAAAVGTWLAIAQGGGTREALDAAMAPVADDARVPWRGFQTPAAQVKQALRSAVAGPRKSIAALAGLAPVKLRLPAALAADEALPQNPFPASRQLGPLAISRIEPAGENLFMIGPRRAACFSAEKLSLRWAQSGNPAFDMGGRRAGDSPARLAAREVSIGSAGSCAAAAPPGGDARAGGTLAALLFHTTLQGTIYDVTGFDAQTGKARWRTRDRADWNNLEPLSEPAASEGLVYVVAAGAVGAADCPVYLVCLDGQTGETRWKTRIGEAAVEGELRELARQGASLTISERRAYASTGLGLLACCDARDGTVTWVRSYASAVQSARLSEQFRRSAPPPLLVGNRLFIAPRDHSGVLALEPGTGRLLWEAELVPSDQLVGLAQDTLVLRAGEELVGIDAGSGRERWLRNVGEPTGAPALVSGSNVIVAARNRLLRLEAATGKGLEALRLTPAPGAETVLLPDGRLLEIGMDAEAVPGAKMANAAAAPQPPLALDWTLPCAYPLLVVPPAGQGPSNMFAVLSGRALLGVKTQPRAGLAWRAVLEDGADSLGFCGSRILVARQRTLTAIDAADGARSWTAPVPFEPQTAGGDARVVFAGDLAPEARVAAFDAASGRLLWMRWFGQEPRFGNGTPAAMTLRSDPAGQPLLVVYWKNALFGAEGWRPGIMTVDAVSGTIRDLRPLMAGEPQWPARAVFGDGRTHVRNLPLPYGAGRVGFQREALAWVGQDSAAHFLSGEADLAPGWKRKVEAPAEGRYAGALSFHLTAGGPYLKMLEQLFFYDEPGRRELVYTLPSAAAQSTRAVFDLRESGDALEVVSCEPPQPPRLPAREFTHEGLKDNTGKGNVTVRWFSGVPPVQWHVGTFGFAEAGASPVATLLDGNIKEHYRAQTLAMSGLSSLGWAKYDVFLYGFLAGEATINGGDRQACTGFDANNPLHRTTFVRNANYVRFAGVSGDAFKIDFSQVNFSAIQIADASGGSQPGRKAASLGVNWDGGGLGLGPDVQVGAEVAAGYWYNIGAKSELKGGYQEPQVYVEVFDRAAGTLRNSQKLPVAPYDVISAFGDRQAVVLPDAVVVADTRGVHVWRAGR